MDLSSKVSDFKRTMYVTIEQTNAAIIKPKAILPETRSVNRAIRCLVLKKKCFDPNVIVVGNVKTNYCHYVENSIKEFACFLNVEISIILNHNRCFRG
jgi:CRISPR/Cas system-associated protein endoribonuclease Cas2